MKHKNRFELAGWILFVICAILFIISSWQSQDMLLLAGSILFFLACILFIIPLLTHKAE
jgi:uncharacterized membrane protein YtjA (UPF0391 family)